MEKYHLDQDIKVFYVTASSFPAGIKPAFDKLHTLIKSPIGRQFFGISYQEEPDNIIYKAAVEEGYPGEAVELSCETFIIKKGEYSSIYIKDFMNDITGIGKAFSELLQDPALDPKGYCLEIYECMDNVRFLVPLRS
jgi:hypothetical protein